MIKKRLLFISLCFALSYSYSYGLDLTFAPSKEKTAIADLQLASVAAYLQQIDLNRPEIVKEVQAKLARGEYYRKSVKDQKGKGTTLTIYVDKYNTMQVITNREEICPVCKGKGTRESPLGKVTGRVDVDLQCLRCKGKGRLPRLTTERAFVLSTEDYNNPQAARAMVAQQAYQNAPPETAAWVDRLASKDPQERLAACEWLDENYVTVGMSFQKIMPMLRKARYQEVSDKRKMMVWQFWAGKDIPEERNRMFYRIYADSKTGKITKKGFYKGN